MNQHLVQFYENDAFLIDEILRFISSGLWAGDTGIVIASKTRLQQIEKRLQLEKSIRGFTADCPGRYILLDATTILSQFMVDGWPDEKRFTDVIGTLIAQASDGGKVHVRAFGEMVSILYAAGKRHAAIRLEEMWNSLAEHHLFFLLCAYPMDNFAGEEHSKSFQHICAAHSRICPSENYRTFGDPDELHRIIAKLQQKAWALEAEVIRRKKIEMALSEREKELSDFLENAVEGLHRLAPDGQILWANKFELDLLGYLPEEYIGHRIADFHLNRKGIDDMLRKVFNGETVYDYPAQMRCKDGSIKHFLIHSNACFENGKSIFVRCYTRDVTALVKLREEQHKRLEDQEAEKILRASHDELESRVRERTARLQKSNAQLVAEIAERKRAEEALQQSQQLLRELALHTEGVIEGERKRIARELHDELGQNLMALRIEVLLMNENAGDAPPRFAANVCSALNNIDVTIKNVRAIINDLRPAVLDLGLYAAIEWVVKEFERRNGIACELVVDHHEYHLDDARAMALFRTVQESLNNVIRHAHADRVEITLHSDGDKLHMRIADNGVGTVPGCRRKANAFGLVGIRERISTLGGELTIDTDPGKGMALTVVLPI